MNIVETIQEKVIHLPPQAQEEILEHVERIEERYQSKTANEHPLAVLAAIRIDDLPADFAERHDFYAHGKLESGSRKGR